MPDVQHTDAHILSVMAAHARGRALEIVRAGQSETLVFFGSADMVEGYALMWESWARRLDALATQAIQAGGMLSPATPERQP